MDSNDDTVVEGPARGIEADCAKCGKRDRHPLKRVKTLQTAIAIAAIYAKQARCSSCGAPVAVDVYGFANQQ